MDTRQKRHLDRSALNLIRIVTASYFMAVSLGLIGGVDAGQLFKFIANPIVGDLTGNGILFVASFVLLSGVYLRTAALVLAIFVLSSSSLENILNFYTGSIDAFWRDLVLVCSVLLNYGVLSQREMRGAGVVKRRYFVRHVSAGDLVNPRRVQPDGVVVTTTRPAEPQIVQADLPADQAQTSPVLDLDAPKGNVFRLPVAAPVGAASELVSEKVTPQKLFAMLAKKSLAATSEDSLDSDDEDEDASFNIFAEDSELQMRKRSGS